MLRIRIDNMSGVFEEFSHQVEFELNFLYRLLELGVSPESTVAELLESTAVASLPEHRRGAGRD